MLMSQFSIFREHSTFCWLEQNAGRKKGVTETGRQKKKKSICQTTEYTNKSSDSADMIDMQEVTKSLIL